jgi:hypothetical protein
MGSRIPAGSQRTAFADQVRAALPEDQFNERIHVAIMVGTR